MISQGGEVNQEGKRAQNRVGGRGGKRRDWGTGVSLRKESGSGREGHLGEEGTDAR